MALDRDCAHRGRQRGPRGRHRGGGHGVGGAAHLPVRHPASHRGKRRGARKRHHFQSAEQGERKGTGDSAPPLPTDPPDGKAPPPLHTLLPSSRLPRTSIVSSLSPTRWMWRSVWPWEAACKFRSSCSLFLFLLDGALGCPWISTCRCAVAPAVTLAIRPGLGGRPCQVSHCSVRGVRWLFFLADQRSPRHLSPEPPFSFPSFILQVFEIAAYFATVVVVVVLLQDGNSTWLKGELQAGGGGGSFYFEGIPLSKPSCSLPVAARSCRPDADGLLPHSVNSFLAARRPALGARRRLWQAPTPPNASEPACLATHFGSAHFP